MDNEQSQYIDALLRNKRASKSGLINGHTRANSDLNLVRQAPPLDSGRLRVQKERRTHDPYFGTDQIASGFHDEEEDSGHLEILSTRE